MTPKEEANKRVDAFRIIIQDEDTDCGNEILCTIIAKKCATLETKNIIQVIKIFGGYTGYEEEVLKQIEKI
jgi:hypothetical protein